METKKSNLINMFVTLVLVTLAAAISLGFVYDWTKEPIAKAKQEKEERAIRAVTGDYDNDPVGEKFYMHHGGDDKIRHRRRKRFRGGKDSKPLQDTLVTSLTTLYLLCLLLNKYQNCIFCQMALSVHYYSLAEPALLQTFQLMSQ